MSEQSGDPKEALRRIRETRVRLAASLERDEAVDERVAEFERKVEALPNGPERWRLEDQIGLMRMQGVQTRMFRELSERLSYVEEAVLHIAGEVGQLKRRLGDSE